MKTFMLPCVATASAVLCSIGWAQNIVPNAQFDSLDGWPTIIGLE
jgi:hypothetical protein